MLVVINSFQGSNGVGNVKPKDIFSYINCGVVFGELGYSTICNCAALMGHDVSLQLCIMKPSNWLSFFIPV